MSDDNPDRPSEPTRLPAHGSDGDRRATFDFIVCGAGSAGSAVARRLSDGGTARVLLLEAGGSDQRSRVMDPSAWIANLGSETDWGFTAEANPHINGRAIPMSMGRVLGGGSSINVMVWARGHRADWDHYAAEAGDEGWGYEAVSEIYRGIEDFHGKADPRRGRGGPVYLQAVEDPGPEISAIMEAAETIGIPVYDNANGAMVEDGGGCALADLIIRAGERHSMFRAYVRPVMDRPNLTVLTDTAVTRVLIEGGRAVGVEALRHGKRMTFTASGEVVLSTGAIQTPKLLMLSGVGDEAELRRLGVPVVRHLPGVGRNLQDHVSFGCIWEFPAPVAARFGGCEVVVHWKSRSGLDHSDLLLCHNSFVVPSDETAAVGVPKNGWTMFAGLAKPKSRGTLRLRTRDPSEAPSIAMNTLSDPEDMETALACVELAREIGNSQSFQGLTTREVLPGRLSRSERENFVRNAAVTYWHQIGSAKMGRDDLSVVDRHLKVYGIDGLRVADGSVLPCLPTGNTMAPCVIVGEKAAAAIRSDHGL